MGGETAGENGGEGKPEGTAAVFTTKNTNSAKWDGPDGKTGNIGHKERKEHRVREALVLCNRCVFSMWHGHLARVHGQDAHAKMGFSEKLRLLHRLCTGGARPSLVPFVLFVCFVIENGPAVGTKNPRRFPAGDSFRSRRRLGTTATDRHHQRAQAQQAHRRRLGNRGNLLVGLEAGSTQSIHN